MNHGFLSVESQFDLNIIDNQKVAMIFMDYPNKRRLKVWALATLVSADDEPELARRVLENALNSAPLALATYAPDGGFHRVISVTETHYFHSAGRSEIEVPAGRTSIEAMNCRPSSMPAS